MAAAFKKTTVTYNGDGTLNAIGYSGSVCYSPTLTSMGDNTWEFKISDTAYGIVLSEFVFRVKISSTAEFTPKTVQTDELRTSLVYEVRIYVSDPKNILRLGMPTTVEIDLK